MKRNMKEGPTILAVVAFPQATKSKLTFTAILS